MMANNTAIPITTLGFGFLNVLAEFVFPLGLAYAVYVDGVFNSTDVV